MRLCRDAPRKLLDEMSIFAASSHQLGMRAALNNPAVLKDKNVVGAANRAQAMRDDKARAAGKEFGEGLLNPNFRQRIDAAGRFIQN